MPEQQRHANDHPRGTIRAGRIEGDAVEPTGLRLA
jgi:hypothetical protein